MKIFLFLSLNVFFIFGVFAQENILGVMVKNGKVIVVKKGKMEKLINDINFYNGSRITSEGIVIQKDGTRIKMNEGEYRNQVGDKVENMYLIPIDNSITDTIK